MANKPKARRYYMPLLKGNDGVLRAPDDLSFSNRDLPLVAELESYIASAFDHEVSVVETSGALYETKVYKPHASDDYTYVIVDDDRIPVERTSPDKEPVSSEEQVLRSWVAAVEHSESISPQESIFIADSFIEPDFDEIDARGAVQHHISWHSVAGMSRVVIIGAPGAGKTTTLRRLALQHLERWREGGSSPFPVYVQMRHFHESKGVEQIVHSNVYNQERPLRKGGAQIALTGKRVVLILDGLDEMPEFARDKASTAIQQFANRNKVVSIVASTREAGYHWNLPQFRYVRIRPFTKEKIREWAYYRLGSEFGGSWLHFITSLEERSSMDELLGNPLMLSICVSLYRRNSALPQNRSNLLKNYFDALVEQWDAVRGVVRQRELWAAPARKLAALCRTAFNARLVSQEYFTAADFSNWNADLNVDHSLLYVCQRDTGAIVESHEPGRWQFAHRIFADYLAARYVVDHTNDSSVAFEPFFKSGDWVDIWACSCGIAQDATTLILLVVRSETLPMDRKIDGLSRAFEQDLIVSETTFYAVVKLFQTEINRLLLSKTVRMSEMSAEKAISFRASNKAATIEMLNLLHSVRRLRKTRLGVQIQDWLLKNGKKKANRLAAIMRAEELLAITFDDHEAIVNVQLRSYLKDLEHLG